MQARILSALKPVSVVKGYCLTVRLMAYTTDISQLRVPYSNTLFTEDKLVSRTDPFAQFQAWLSMALDCKEIQEAMACSLATCSKDGRPSNRMILMKSYDDTGLSFFTNYESQKGCHLLDNPFASMLFYWPPFHRQVRIEGRVEKLSESISNRYFHSRPYSSKISASVSRQSTEIASREVLDGFHHELQVRYPNKDGVVIPCPPNWGGYKLVPLVFEFWQGQSSRLHDRIVYSREKEEDEWVLKRLAP